MRAVTPSPSYRAMAWVRCDPCPPAMRSNVSWCTVMRSSGNVNSPGPSMKTMGDWTPGFSVPGPLLAKEKSPQVNSVRSHSRNLFISHLSSR